MLNLMTASDYAEDARHLAELSPRELGRTLESFSLAYLRNLAGHLNVATAGVTGQRVSGTVMVANVYRVIAAMRVKI